MANLDRIYGVDDRPAAFENHESGLLVSLAGPGTGKTYSLLKRIEALDSRGEPGSAVCYLTFIKEITNAFIADYIDAFGVEQFEAGKPRISTLHSFACRLIRNQGFRIGYGGELYFMSVTGTSADGSSVFLQDLLPLVAIGELRTVPRLRKLLDEKIKEAWRNCTDPMSLEDPIPAALQTCLRLMKVYRLVDWDQTIPMAHSLLGDAPERPTWISQIDHFLVDEYQDFNLAEQAFIEALAATAQSTVIVGDDDQSLYSRRGGSPEGLRALYSNGEHDRVSLVRCRRSKTRIVEAANTFLFSMRSDPRPMLPLTEGGEVQCFRFKSTKTELSFLAGFLTDCLKRLPENPRSKDGTICLFPSWKCLEFYFDQLSELGVPCFKRKFDVDPRRVRLQRAMELVCRPYQRWLERLILEDFKAIKPRHKNRMVGLICEHDISPAEAFDILIETGALKEPALSEAAAFCNFCRTLGSRDPATIAADLSELLGINRDELCQHIENFVQSLSQPEPDLDQEEIISDLCDKLIPDSERPQENPCAILFLTMHGSKGLTKNTVVMPGLEDAWLPGEAEGSNLEEKKRLFYVALTRATDRVLVTHPMHRAQRDPLNYKTAGRGEECSFVADAGIPRRYHD